MSVSYGGDSIVFADGSVQSGGWTGFKNRIINGAMVIDQRNAGASVTIPANLSTYSVDRWFGASNQASKFTIQQNTATPPNGFKNYIGVTSLSAYSVLTGDYFGVQQNIEGYNIADLGWGTASAQTVTLSFWVRSSLTGTFGAVVKNSTGNRSYAVTYTISSQNTWEYKTITVPGDTTGTWLTDNGTGISIQFGLGAGSTYSATAGSWQGSNLVSATSAVSVVGTSGATWQVTGVQLERGSTASSFEYRSYGAELVLCQRYYEKSYPIEVVPGTGISNGEYCFWYGYGANSAGSSTNAIECWTNNVFKVQKRASVTVVTYDLAGNSGQASRYYTGVSPAGNVANTVNLQTQMGWKNTVAAGSAANGFLLNWTASAEL
jgi:hypothetical protein